MTTSSPARLTVAGRFARGDVYEGTAALAILDDRGRQTEYRVSANGLWLLTRLDDGTTYSLPRDLSACSCPDATYRPLRPGGCKHQVALRAALLNQKEAPHD